MAAAYVIESETARTVNDGRARSEADNLLHRLRATVLMKAALWSYHERHKLDWTRDPRWSILFQEHRRLASVDLALLWFELDEVVGEVSELVFPIFGGLSAPS